MSHGIVRMASLVALLFLPTLPITAQARVTYAALTAPNLDRFVTINNPKGVKGTTLNAINSQGDIVGGYQDSSGIEHAFLLHQGTYTTIDDPMRGG